MSGTRNRRRTAAYTAMLAVIVMGLLATSVAFGQTSPDRFCWRHCSTTTTKTSSTASTASASTTKTTATSSSSTSSTTQTTSNPSTFILTYDPYPSSPYGGGANPTDVASTSDGGYVFTSELSSGNLYGSWLVKIDASGKIQFQTQAVCGSDLNLVGVQQTSDGGYIAGGGGTNCGSGSGYANCGALSGYECPLVMKFDPSGNLQWAKVYDTPQTGMYNNNIQQIRQTSDGGYIAVGISNGTDALVLRLDGSGNVQWAAQIPASGGTNQNLFKAVLQTSDGGYLAAGYAYYYNSGSYLETIILVKFDSNGNNLWQQSYNQFNGGGQPTGYNSPRTIIPTSDGGYLIAGSTKAGVSYGYTGSSYLLLKLDSIGDIQWQQAYNGGPNLAGEVYSAHQTSDGGYLLTGYGETIPCTGCSPMGYLPWGAKVDSSGNLLWQHVYYQASSTGRSLSSYFWSSTLSSGGGFLAVGDTQNYANLHALDYVVKTDSNGLCGGNCPDVRAPVPLTMLNPGLTTSRASLSGSSTVPSNSGTSIMIQVTSAMVAKEC